MKIPRYEVFFIYDLLAGLVIPTVPLFYGADILDESEHLVGITPLVTTTLLKFQSNKASIIKGFDNSYSDIFAYFLRTVVIA